MKIEWFSLKFDKNRQIKITTNRYQKEILLYKNGSPYFISQYCARWKYVGCGIDAGHSFIAWFKDDISRKQIIKKIKSVKIFNNIIRFFDNLADRVTDILPAPYDYDSKRQNEYFTTPNMLKTGIRKLIAKYISEELSHKVIHYKKGNDIDIITRIAHHLASGMPIITLINSGTHWVTVVGITIQYQDIEKSIIDIDRCTISYIDLTKGTTIINTKYKYLKILGWENNTKRKWSARVGYDSYHEGSLITVENNQLLISEEINSYHIRIVTGNVKNASTKSDVYITLIGKNWQSKRYLVQTICNDFQKNTASEFDIVEDNDYKDIQQVIIEHKNSDKNQKWFLETVFIRTKQKLYTFKAHQWISDKAILSIF